ncbi:MAG TPA: sulfite reductase, partial [Alcanivorax sp.]|nr:sulfite reductase [Alcanivorax sp.]
EAIADLADRYSFGELRNTHQQNMVLSDVATDDLFELWEKLDALGMATPNLGLLTDIVACPGGDLCALANAKSVPVAEGIQRRFDDMDYVHDLGPLDINISGCMNACGHHHIGHIG